MILINGEQVGLRDLPKALGVEIPIEKITKRAVFEINPAMKQRDPANGPHAFRVRQGIDFPAKWFHRLKGGKSVEIRYCTSMTPNSETEGRTYIYSPKFLKFDGEAEYFGENEELAVIYYLHFFCKSSPLRDKNSPVWEYDFVDNEAKANARIDIISKKREALAFVDRLDLSQMNIMAKALRIPGAHAMDTRTLQAEVSERAMNNPEEFMAKANSQTAQIEGLIIDAIDKGIFQITSQYGMKQWKWAKGTMKGSLIVELPDSVTKTDDALITHIKAGHIQEMLPVLINTMTHENANATAEKDLEDFDILSALGGNKESVETESEETDTQNGEEPKFPESYAEALNYIGWATGKKSTQWGSRLNKAIQSGDVTPETIERWLDNKEYENA